MTIKAAKMDEPKKAAAVKQAGIKQKIKKQAATGKKEVEQKTTAGHAAPAKEDAPVTRCNVSFPGVCTILVSAAVFYAVAMALSASSCTQANVTFDLFDLVCLLPFNAKSCMTSFFPRVVDIRTELGNMRAAP